MSDPRNTLARDGLASASLEGVAPAEFYRPAVMTQCRQPSAAIRARPELDAEQLDALLLGEGFEVLEVEGGWALGQARRDGYVGYVAQTALGDPLTPTHRVSTLSTPVFERPDIKSPILAFLSQNALLTVVGAEGRFIAAADGGYVVENQTAPVGVFDTDPVEIALRYLNAPYVWGGRDARGLDCSGLVQQALYACGRACPRDSDQQRAMGEAIELGRLTRGDLVFWPGHVAWMLEEARILHANAFHMQVAIEPLTDAIVRIGEPMALRRIG